MSVDSVIEQIGEFISIVVNIIPFSSATWIVLGILFFFVWLFTKAQRSPQSAFKWEHFFIESETNRASPYKLGYMIGLIVGTWVIISFADGDKLTWDIFGGYLAYLLGGAGWSAMMKTRENTTAINRGYIRPSYGYYDDRSENFGPPPYLRSGNGDPNAIIMDENSDRPS